MTKNFSLNEFSSPDTNVIPFKISENLQKLADNLQVLRDHFDAPITVNSGYRSPAHNKKVGGASRSQHLLGKAADIVVEGVSPDDVADAIELLIEQGKISQGGLGRYNSFTHYDIRGTKARWDFRK